MNEQMKSLINAYGWVDVPSRNPRMISFCKEEDKARLNVYFTTMTVTYQTDRFSCKTYKRVDDIDYLEDILIENEY